MSNSGSMSLGKWSEVFHIRDWRLWWLLLQHVRKAEVLQNKTNKNKLHIEAPQCEILNISQQLRLPSGGQKRTVDNINTPALVEGGGWWAWLTPDVCSVFPRLELGCSKVCCSVVVVIASTQQTAQKPAVLFNYSSVVKGMQDTHTWCTWCTWCTTHPLTPFPSLPLYFCLLHHHHHPLLLPHPLTHPLLPHPLPLFSNQPHSPWATSPTARLPLSLCQCAVDWALRADLFWHLRRSIFLFRGTAGMFRGKHTRERQGDERRGEGSRGEEREEKRGDSEQRTSAE